MVTRQQQRQYPDHRHRYHRTPSQGSPYTSVAVGAEIVEGGGVVRGSGRNESVDVVAGLHPPNYIHRCRAGCGDDRGHLRRRWDDRGCGRRRCWTCAMAVDANTPKRLRPLEAGASREVKWR
jgi:hypothetical protein